MSNSVKRFLFGLLMSIGACTFMVVLHSCAKVKLVYPWDLQGHVIIRPDNGAHLLPALRYHFYGTEEAIQDTCDGRGNYAGNLPSGTYCVVAANMDLDYMQFSGMNDKETAIVSLTAKESVVRGDAVFFCPGDLFSITLDDLICSAGDTVRRIPNPTLLTKRIVLTVTLGDGLNGKVTAISGILHGVLPSVHLFRCSTSGETLNPVTGAMTFTTLPENADWCVEIPLFGIRNPKWGAAYRNEIELYVTRGNDPEPVIVDISNYLSDALADNDGELPLRAPLTITLDTGDDILLSGEVTSWEDSGTGSGEVLP